MHKEYKIYIKFLAYLFVIMTQTIGAVSELYEAKRENLLHINASVTYYPAEFRYLELSAQDIKLHFPIYNFNIGVSHQTVPAFHFTILLNYFIGAGTNSQDVKEYSLKTTANRNGFYFGFGPSFYLHTTEMVSISADLLLNLGYCQESVKGTTQYQNVKIELFDYVNNGLSFAFIPRLAINFTFKEKHAFSIGVLGQFSRTSASELWEDNSLNGDINTSEDIGRGLGIFTRYMYWVKRKK